MISSRGVLTIYEGSATAVTWTPCIGSVRLTGSGHITYTSNLSGVYFGSNNQLLSSALTLPNKTVTGDMYVFTRGTASDVTISSNGYTNVFSGGKIDSVYVHSGGSLYIYSGASYRNVQSSVLYQNISIFDGAI